MQFVLFLKRWFIEARIPDKDMYINTTINYKMTMVHVGLLNSLTNGHGKETKYFQSCVPRSLDIFNPNLNNINQAQ